MGRRPELVRDSSWLAGSDLVVVALGLVGQAFLAKSLLRSDFGLMVVLIDAFAVMFLFIDAGLPTIITRDVPRARHQCRALVGQTYRIQAVLCLVMLPPGLLIGFSLWPAAPTELLLACGGIAIVHVFTYAPRSALRALGEARQEAIVKFIERGVVTSGYGLLTWVGITSPTYYASAFLLGVVLSLVYALFAASRLWNSVLIPTGALEKPSSGLETPQESRENILLSNKELILSALPFAITLGVIPLIGRFEKLLLSAYHGTAEVAVFHVAFLAYLAGLTLPQAIRAAMLPILGQIRADISATRSEIRKARRIILWLIPLGLVGGVVVVKLLMQVAFSDYVVDSYGLFLILLAGWAITMLTAPNYVAVQAGNNPWKFTMMLFIGVTIAIASALVLIPELGVVGAAYSSVAGALALGVVAVVFSGEFSPTSTGISPGHESE